MENTKDDILKVDGVSDIVMLVAELRTERDYYKEKYESLLYSTIGNTRLGFRANLTVEDSDEFNFMLKFLAPVEYEERLEILKAKEKAEKDAKAREEAKANE